LTATIAVAGLLSGVLALAFTLPLALSSPFPAAHQGDWIIQATVRPPSAAASLPRPQTPLAVTTEAEAPDAETVVAKRSLAVAPPVPAPVKTRPAVERAAFAARWPFATAAAHTPDPTPTGSVRLALADETAPAAAAPRSLVRVPAEATQIKPATRKTGTEKRPVNPMDEVDRYLWQVYEREPVKKDSSGDFTWKDPAAAKRLHMSLMDYVIRGMDADFREQLYHAGHAMDAAGLHWSMLSAFRDDYRQTLAAGFKARTGNSLHGGSRAVGGYGHGRAIDIMNIGGDDETVWHWVDAHGARYGLRRPMPGYDPAHIQSGGDWHRVAEALRASRARLAEKAKPATAAVRPKDAKTPM
jgi:hypothetical protein